MHPRHSRRVRLASGASSLHPRENLFYLVSNFVAFSFPVSRYTFWFSNYFCCFDLQRHTGSTRWKHSFLWFFDWWVHAQAQTIEIILEIPRIPRLRRLARRTGFLARRTGFLARDCARLREVPAGFLWFLLGWLVLTPGTHHFPTFSNLAVDCCMALIIFQCLPTSPLPVSAGQHHFPTFSNLSPLLFH